MDKVFKITDIIIPSIVIIIIIFGIVEKKRTFNIFIEGVKEELKTIYDIFPTMIAIFLAINILKSSGVLDFITQHISFITNLLKIPNEVIPLAILRPISGSASLGMLTSVLKEYGVDSKIGLIASTIMASTETTLYIITLYTSVIGIKKLRFVLISAIIADIIGIVISAYVWNFFL